MFGPYGGLTSGTVYNLPALQFLLASDEPSLEEDVVEADLDHNVMQSDFSCHFPAATHIFRRAAAPLCCASTQSQISLGSFLSF